MTEKRRRQCDVTGRIYDVTTVGQEVTSQAGFPLARWARWGGWGPGAGTVLKVKIKNLETILKKS